MATPFAALRALDGADWGPGATEAEVASLESALGCRLPDDYREFLIEFGWYEAPAITVSGICTGETNGWRDAAELGRWELEESRAPLPGWLLPISNDGAGNLRCLVLHGEKAGSVVFVDHDPDDPDEFQPWADTFSDFLRQELDIA